MNCRICGAELPDGAMFCGECGSSTSATPESRRPLDPRPGDTSVIHRSESGVINVALDPLPPIDEATAEAPAAASDASPTFVLTFTTGEVVTVSGTGLIGRRPTAEAGESFAHLVQIVDRGLSVSKTHLEFGEHEGGLWVEDRFSSNGTVVRRPGEAGLRCEPGRRVLAPRGTLIEIGEQAFTVA